MPSITPSLAELLDRAGDREDARVLERAHQKPVEIVGGWRGGDDDILPSGRGRHQGRFSLRRALGN
jgi:hypothetical protein